MAVFKRKERKNAHRVAVCDDQAEIRALYKRLLEKEGNFELVGEAANGQQAIDLVREHHPDAILLDFAMPEMNGVEALRKIKEASPDTKIVVVTSFFAMGEEALGMGADGFVSKSSKPKEIIAALTDALTGASG